MCLSRVAVRKLALIQWFSCSNNPISLPLPKNVIRRSCVYPNYTVLHRVTQNNGLRIWHRVTSKLQLLGEADSSALLQRICHGEASLYSWSLWRRWWSSLEPLDWKKQSSRAWVRSWPSLLFTAHLLSSCWLNPQIQPVDGWTKKAQNSSVSSPIACVHHIFLRRKVGEKSMKDVVFHSILITVWLHKWAVWLGIFMLSSLRWAV